MGCHSRPKKLRRASISLPRAIRAAWRGSESPRISKEGPPPRGAGGCGAQVEPTLAQSSSTRAVEADLSLLSTTKLVTTKQDTADRANRRPAPLSVYTRFAHPQTHQTTCGQHAGGSAGTIGSGGCTRAFGEHVRRDGNTAAPAAVQIINGVASSGVAAVENEFLQGEQCPPSVPPPALPATGTFAPR